MDPQERDAVFSRAMMSNRLGNAEAAFSDLARLVNDGSREPLHLSYCGLLMATTQGKLKEGLSLCEQALTINFFEPQLHLNLAQVYLRSGNRPKAIETLLRGVHAVPRDGRLHQELSRLVPRARPVFRQLSRSHPLNKYVGLARFRLAQLLQGFKGSSPMVSL